MKYFLRSVFFTFSFSLIFSYSHAQQTWSFVGNEYLSSPHVANYPDIAIDKNGTPYVAYNDDFYYVLVEKFNGNNWEYVGGPPTNAWGGDVVSIDIDTGGIPYVMFETINPNGGNNLNVMKYDNTNGWVNVGPPEFATAGSGYEKIAIDHNNTPYIIFASNTFSAPICMKFDGSNWVYVGPSTGVFVGSAPFFSFAIDNNNIPYIAYQNGSIYLSTSVIKYDGNNWVNVGASGLGFGSWAGIKIAIDANNTPYIAYRDGANNGAAVLKFDGSNWIPVGYSGFYTGTPTDIAIDRTGIPYLLLYNDPQQLSVMKFNGNEWVYVGNANFSSGSANFESSLAIDSSNVPYVVYNSHDGFDYAIAMSFNGLPTITGNAHICIGDTTALTDARGGGTWSSSNNTIATINTLGIVSGISAGTDTISYTLSDSVTTYEIYVASMPPVANAITGGSEVCVDGGTLTLNNITPGGVWSVSNNIFAAVDQTGIVSGLFTDVPGNDTVFYTINNGCGVVVDTLPIAVETPPSAGTITGPAYVCTGDTIYLINTTASMEGTWMYKNPFSLNAIDSNTGSIVGISPEMDTILYITINVCNADTATYPINIYQTVQAAPIIGPSYLCVGSSANFTDTVAGGEWLSDYGPLASITDEGTVTALLPGQDIIQYYVSTANACQNGWSSLPLTIIDTPYVGPIIGSSSICIGLTMQMHNMATNGIWTSSDTSIATIDSNGLFTPISGGVDTVTYSQSNACGTSSAYFIVTVYTSPIAPGPITGDTSLCPNSTITLSDSVAGGYWASNNTAVATINSNGIVTGISAGTTLVSYVLSNPCGNLSVQQNITVLPSSDCSNDVEIEALAKTIKIYPNPATSIVNIKAAQTINIKLADMEGKIIYRIANAKNIDINPLAAGVYMLSVYNADNILIKTVKLTKTE